MGNDEEATPLLSSSSSPEQPPRARQLLVGLCGSLVAMIVGSIAALPSSLISQLIEEGLAKNLEEAAFLGTSYLYTAGPASLVGGLLGDCRSSSNSPPVLATSSPTLMWILPSRILSAVGSWLSYSCGSILIAEFAHPSLRGMLCSMPSVFLAVGMLVTYTLGALLPWRLMSWLLLAQPPLLLLLLLIIPESPQWLALQGQAEKARASLVWV